MCHTAPREACALSVARAYANYTEEVTLKWLGIAAVGAHVWGMSKAAVLLVFLRDSIQDFEHGLERYAKLAASRWSARRSSHL